MPTKILIADDHAVIRHGLGMIVKDLISFADISYAEDFDSLLKELAAGRVDLIICDVKMPGNAGVQIVTSMRGIQPNVPILIFSVYPEELYGLRYLQEGANGYLHKDADVDTIHKAITDILSKGRFISDHLLKLYANNIHKNVPLHVNPFSLLSNREMEIAMLLVKGYGTLEMSNAFDLHVSTVSTYKSRIYKKLGLNNISDLIILFQNYNVQIG